MKIFSIICNNRIEFLDCQKILFELGYFWNTVSNNQEEEKTEIKDYCNNYEFPVALLINYKNSNKNSFIYDEKYKHEKITDPFYINHKLINYKHFSRKYKLKKLNENR